MITHPYHGGEGPILDDNGRVKPEYWEARKRGIEVDLGLDRFHCDLDIMKRAMEQDFLPDYIGTDLAMTNINSIVFDLPTTVSKVMAAGMSLTEALSRCTIAPAVKIGKADELGRIEEGRVADVALFEIGTDGYTFEDFFGNAIQGKEKLIPRMTIRKGEILKPVTRTTEVLDVFNRGNPWLARKAK